MPGLRHIMVTSESWFCVKLLHTTFLIHYYISNMKISEFRINRIFPSAIQMPIHSLIHRRTIRVPKYWRLQKNVSGKTIDPEFEELVEELDAIDDACHEMIDIHKVYSLIVMESIASSHRVVNSFHILSRPGANSYETESDFDEAWQTTQSYQCALEETNLAMKEGLSCISSELDVKINALMALLNHIHSHINRRDALLTRYERLLDRFDSMTISGASMTFSRKQKLEYASLEESLEAAKVEYSNCNAMICMELPYFFALVRKFMEPALELLLLIHLSIAYQTQQNFLSLEEDLGISGLTEGPCFISDYVEQFNLPDPKEIEALEIVRFHRNYLDQLVRSTDENTVATKLNSCTQYCKALYEYNSDIEEDLNFSKGDMIKILRQSGKWWEGEVNGKQGIFPMNYVLSCDKLEATSEPIIEEVESLVEELA